jgi:hypothetical protein
MGTTVVHGVNGSFELVERDLPSFDRNGNARTAIFKTGWLID